MEQPISASRAAMAKAVVALLDAYKNIGQEEQKDSDSSYVFYFNDVVLAPEKLHREPKSAPAAFCYS